MSNLKIYIYSHKDFVPPVQDSCYEILSETPITKTSLKQHDVTTGDNIQRFGAAYGELKGLYWLYKNIKDLPDYIGFVHYRRYFSFMDNIPTSEELFGDSDIIIPISYKSHVSLVKQYAIGHNVNDLLDCCKIACKQNGTVCFTETLGQTLNQNNIYFCNAFIMKKEDFMEYCKWLFEILFDFDNLRGFTDYNDVVKYVNGNQQFYKKPMYELSYQYRLHGFIGERLFNIWLHYKFDKKKEYEFREI